jgi:hypothetical protein
VEEKQDAIVTILLDWLCKIFTLVINDHLLTIACKCLKSKDLEKLGVEDLGSTWVNICGRSIE